MTDAPRLVLASQSASRRAMLAAAGIAHDAVANGLDEEAAKAALAAEGLGARDFADALAELKAMRAATRVSSGLVLGADSVVAAPDGGLLDKPAGRDDAATQLRRLSGAQHDLYSAAVIVEGGRPVWRHIGHARLHVRALSDAFIEAYLEAEWPAISGCVGCYRVEGMGAQLFHRVEGDHWTILGLPLLPLAAYLRDRGVLLS
ncbi:Maf family protein [Sphingomonas desiccabilis]|uniref:Nucleoside triphosphate pyrophosphatase n=1 Tax=Sphingomonas desiccabilis TaxID=429134 RepID=A0A4Q2IM18_9SPHN|nr:Maf family protein [Sphingomonas desiccabilis]MBB3912179.1 septum formation protein [Sphingomonas desiccabilis]RXZ30340.1 Maf-like protein [Sphingomonas desiccabilis]